MASDPCGLLMQIAATKPLNLTTAKSGWHLANYDERASLAPFKVLAESSKGIDPSKQQLNLLILR
jgi:hypothetical protein